VKAGLLAEFASPDQLLEALGALRREGYRQLETYTPYPLEEAEHRLGLARSRLPRFIFGGGLLGAILGYGIQWYADVWSYPQNVGGRPVHAVPAFIPATFEATVLGAALVAFFGLLLALRLPELWTPVFEIDGFERASVDRYWVGVDGRDRRFEPERVRRLLEGLHPLRVVPLPEDA
jgi:hypothetical protein